MQNLRSSIRNALASSLAPLLSNTSPFARGLLLALPLLAVLALLGSLLDGVGCKRAERLGLVLPRGMALSG